MRRLFEEQVPIDDEFRLPCKNGSFRWFAGAPTGLGHSWETLRSPDPSPT